MNNDPQNSGSVPGQNIGTGPRGPREGWSSMVARLAMGVLAFEAISGLAIRFLPFHGAVEWSVIVHTVVGLLAVLPVVWYLARHWTDYRRYALSQAVLLGGAGLLSLVVCGLSGLVVTWQGVFGVKTSGLWRDVHLYSTFFALATVVPHVGVAFLRAWKDRPQGAQRGYVTQSILAVVAGGGADSGTPGAFRRP